MFFSKKKEETAYVWSLFAWVFRVSLGRGGLGLSSAVLKVGCCLGSQAGCFISPHIVSSNVKSMAIFMSQSSVSDLKELLCS